MCVWHELKYVCLCPSLSLSLSLSLCLSLPFPVALPLLSNLRRKRENRLVTFVQVLFITFVLDYLFSVSNLVLVKLAGRRDNVMVVVVVMMVVVVVMVVVDEI